MSDNEAFKSLVAERTAAKAAGTKPAGTVPAAKAPLLRPRDAATLIIIDSAGSAPKILLGKRRPDLKFMPGKYVFPGGRMDADDKSVVAARELRQGEADKLLIDMKGRPSAARARGLALTAIRETFEEAGLIIGGAPAAASSDDLAPPSENPSLESPAAKTWRLFREHGFAPDLAPLTYLARAITPPGRPRRFDTRFFCIEASAIAKTTDYNDGELSGLVWMTLTESRDLDLPPITRVILEDLAERIAARSLDDPSVPIPYYFNRSGTFRRETIG